MNRGRLEPLGVPGSDLEINETAARGAPSSLDRWLIRTVMNQLGANTPVRAVLWDEPDVTPRDGIVRVRIMDRKALWMVAVNPDLNFGDLFSAGRIEVRGSLQVLLEEVYRAASNLGMLASVVARFRALAPDVSESKRNIHHHYDIGNDFYNLWLDREAHQYTCAYFADPSMTIEQAQQAKMHHVCRKLQLKPGETVVEAGSGWGGFALFMAQNYGVRVRTFNISKEQVAFARDWAKQRNLDHQVEFVEDDYRNATGTYDAFVSIGMLEHVGVGNYKGLGALMAKLIGPNGRGLVHSIGRDTPAMLNAWIDKRIFPGAQPPTIRQMMDMFEPNGLSVLDLENIRLHYAKTIDHWLHRFEASAGAIAGMFDDTFVRAWRMYLAGSRAAFTTGSMQLFQVVFARGASSAIPWIRVTS